MKSRRLPRSRAGCQRAPAPPARPPRAAGRAATRDRRGTGSSPGRRCGSRPRRRRAGRSWRSRMGLWAIGGERGIRTLDTLLTYTRFPSVRLKPLGHLSAAAAILTREELSEALHQVTVRERLGDIEVGAAGEALLDVRLPPFGRQHDDLDGRELRARANLHADLVAAAHRHHHIQHDEVRAPVAQARERLLAGARDIDFVAFAA